MSDLPSTELSEALRERLEEQLEAERELSRRLGDYVGRWVAVRAHEVVAEADTLEELLKRMPEDAEAVLQVEERSGAAAFF